ncbi:unnamed protein product [Tetraodon nigroviridis]|uniref:(spotted green pufferfish) hypothetical protein n=1 Tax=Tetraodon nigroviridis TaxID=99883 RepID=Q4S045_TETNG|nr:unnamed protein product [Tetraodon nigroviridis]
MSPDAGLIDFQIRHCRFSTPGKREFTWQFEAVNIPDWKLSLSRAFSLMFTPSDRLLLHGDGGLGCTRLTRRCSFRHAESPGPRPFGLRWCKHPTLSCDLLPQRLREGCLLELAGSDTLARSEPSERRQGPRSRATGSSSQLFQTAERRLEKQPCHLVYGLGKSAHVLTLMRLMLK